MRRLGILLTLLLVFCTGCQQQSAQESCFLMDTVMELTVWGDGAEEAVQAGQELLEHLDKQLSAVNPDSEIYQYNQGKADALSPEIAALVERAGELEKETDGAFSPNLGALTALWGFTGGTPAVPDAASLNQALSDRSQLDLGGIAKGYAGDRLKALWEELGVESALASLGGNVVALGSRWDGSPWRVGIRDPFGQETDLLGILEVCDCCVVTSGGYERFFEQDGLRYHHLLDPETGMPAENGLVSVTVVCADGTRADALSTAFYVLGKDAALEYWQENADLEFILVEENGTVTVTDGLWDVFSPEEQEGLTFVQAE